jgi:hypothetical protein
MTNYFCAWLRNKMCDLAFSVTAWTPPATLYCGLATSITDAGAITGEPATANNYARVTVNNNTMLFPGATTGNKYVNLNVVFNQANNSWGTPTVVFLSDATSGNTNTWLWGTISNSRAIGSGDTVYFAPLADIQISIQ